MKRAVRVWALPRSNFCLFFRCTVVATICYRWQVLYRVSLWRPAAGVEVEFLLFRDLRRGLILIGQAFLALG